MHSTHLNSLHDLELIHRYQTLNDINCIGVLYQRYTHLIVGVSRKYLKDDADTEDACNDIFELLLKKLKVAEIKSFEAWLYFVCKSFCLMKLRNPAYKNIFEREQSFETIVENEDVFHLATVENEKEFQLSLMDKCIEGLKDEQRLCIELFFLKEKSYNEVALATNFSMNNVKSFIQNGRRNLKICMEQQLTSNG